MSWRDLKEVAREFLQKYNERGQEVPDPTPVEVPFKWRRPMDIHEMIARAVQSHEIQKKWTEQGLESWDEANDFDVDDAEPEFESPYELKDMQEEFYTKDRVSHSERKVKGLAKSRELEEDDGTVNSDRIKEKRYGKRENGKGRQSQDRGSVKRDGESVDTESEQD